MRGEVVGAAAPEAAPDLRAFFVCLRARRPLPAGAFLPTGFFACFFGPPLLAGAFFLPVFFTARGLAAFFFAAFFFAFFFAAMAVASLWMVRDKNAPARARSQWVRVGRSPIIDRSTKGEEGWT